MDKAKTRICVSRLSMPLPARSHDVAGHANLAAQRSDEVRGDAGQARTAGGGCAPGGCARFELGGDDGLHSCIVRNPRAGCPWGRRDQAGARDCQVLVCYSRVETALSISMDRVLDYSSLPPRDRLTTFLTVATWLLFPLDTIAAIFLGTWHNGLRSLPVVTDLQTRDVVATTGICGTPLVGIIFALLLIWRCRRGRWAGILLGVAGVLFHAWSLYVWGTFEAWFWSH